MSRSHAGRWHALLRRRYARARRGRRQRVTISTARSEAREFDRPDSPRTAGGVSETIPSWCRLRRLGPLIRARSQHAGGHAARDRECRQRRRHHRTGSDDGAAPDIGHDHGGGPNPHAFADPDKLAHAGLVANWHVESLDAVYAAAARDMNGRSDQDVSLEMHEPDVTVRPDVHTVI